MCFFLVALDADNHTYSMFLKENFALGIAATVQHEELGNHLYFSIPLPNIDSSLEKVRFYLSQCKGKSINLVFFNPLLKPLTPSLIVFLLLIQGRFSSDKIQSCVLTGPSQPVSSEGKG
jgi:hypothetical protein